MTPRPLRRTAGPLAACILVAALSACSIIESDKHTSFTGNYVPADALSQIKVGESTPSYVEAVLGEPTSRTDLEDGSAIWRWDYTETRSSDGSLFLVFDGESSTTKKRSTYVEFRDGVVARKWRS